MRRFCVALVVAEIVASLNGMALAAELLKQKAALRRSIRGSFADTSDAVISELSALVCEKVLGLEVVKRARGVCAFLSMPKELQTRELLGGLFAERYSASSLEEVEANAGERLVCVPKVLGKDRFDMIMVPISGGFEEIESFPLNKWNIPEPVVDPEASREQLINRLAALLEVVVVPGVAFDQRCCRLGHGKGYYDTFLQTLTTARAAQKLPPPITIGVGLGFQIVDEIPTEEHDQVLDAVITPEDMYTTSDQINLEAT